MTARVEPEWAMATLLFVDIRGFTSFADRSTARETVAFLNEFFELIVPIVTAHGGHANKLLGDGLLASFGAPDRLDGHADAALAAGSEILAAVEGHAKVGIGINSGLVLVGTVGGGGLTELGLIGDPVNVAARVQDATRELGEPLLITDATRCLLDGWAGSYPLEPRGAIALRGKPEPVAVYAPLRNASRTPAA